MLPLPPEFQSNQSKNLIHLLPLPDDAFREIWSNLIKIGKLTLEIYIFESVDGRR